MNWLLRCLWIVLLTGLPTFSSMVQAQEPKGAEMLLDVVKGEKIRLADFRGKVVLVNFWATWCPPCRDEIPDLIKAQSKYGSRGFVVLGVDFMESADEDRLTTFIDKFQINYPVVFGGNDRMQSLAQSLGGVFGLPTTFLLDRQGRVVYTHTGAMGEGLLKRVIEPVL